MFLFIACLALLCCIYQSQNLSYALINDKLIFAIAYLLLNVVFQRMQTCFVMQLLGRYSRNSSF